MVLVVGLTALLQAISGFGFALLSVPLFALRIDVHEAVVLSSCIGTISSGWQTLFLRKNVDAVSAKRYIGWSLVGIPAGFALFVALSDQVLRIIVGVAVLFGTLVVAFGKEVKVSRAWERALGVLSGALLIATSTNGPPIVLAMQAQRMPMHVFRATLARIFSVTGVISVVLFLVAGEIDHQIARVGRCVTAIDHRRDGTRIMRLDRRDERATHATARTDDHHMRVLSRVGQGHGGG